MVGDRSGRKKLICGYCRSGSANLESLKRCLLCGKMLCEYHRKPESHACESVDWEGLKAKGRSEMGVIDYLKAGAVILAVMLIAKFGLDMLSGAWQAIKRSGEIARAESKVLVAVPVAMMALAGMFPDATTMLKGAADNVIDKAGLDSIHISFPQMPALPQNPPPGLAPISGIRGCTLAMSYATTLYNQYDKCPMLCKERGYTTYANVRMGGSYDCYCCHGSGTPV
ncbi:hypothetical protein L0Y65_01620 [Candidatus Micrarchaeota archaeon]|nr:hypothetical protein [Candidatus Micrarchaeota archaeon]